MNLPTRSSIGSSTPATAAGANVDSAGLAPLSSNSRSPTPALTLPDNKTTVNQTQCRPDILASEPQVLAAWTARGP